MKIHLRTATSVMVFSAMATSAFAESADEGIPKEKALFVQHSESTALSDGVLTLNGINKHMIVFSDRPFRAVATMPTAGLIKIWSKGKDSFADDPPNAVLTGEVDGKATSVIVELTNPQLSEGSLTFDYVLLKGQDSVTLDKSYMVLDESLWGDVDWSLHEVTNEQIGAVALQHIPG